MDKTPKSLTCAYRQLGEAFNCSAEVAELRAIRHIHSDYIFYPDTRQSFPSDANNYSSTTSVAYLNRPELYLPAIQTFEDIQKTDFSNIQNVLDVLITAGVECCIFATGDNQIDNYLQKKDIFFSNMKSCYDIALRHDGVMRLNAHEKKQRMLNLHLSFELGVCNEGSFVQTKFTIPTRYKSFQIFLYELNNRFYLSVPKASIAGSHPDNETFFFEGPASQSNIYDLIYKRYKHRVFHHSFKKQFDRYFNDDIKFEGLDIWSTVQLMDAIKM